jgi:N-acylneuraminate cytidylyltransferase
LTDNRVFVDSTGRESVAAYRSDSLGLNRLRAAGVEVLVLSTETDGVVKARCDKIKLPVVQGVADKAARLRAILAERRIDSERVVYLGNDINDLPCFPLVACAVVVADALPAAARQADLRLSRKGGFGAVRALCDMILTKKGVDLWQM